MLMATGLVGRMLLISVAFVSKTQESANSSTSAEAMEATGFSTPVLPAEI